jgi:hypothetical protein
MTPTRSRSPTVTRSASWDSKRRNGRGGGAKRKVVGTIDGESEEKDTFSEADRSALERCAAAVAGLFKT